MSFFSPEAVKARSEAAKKSLNAAAKKKASTPTGVRALAEEQTPHISGAIALVANQNYSDATQIIQDLLSQRVVAALDEYKHTVAQNLFAPSVELSEEKEDDKEDEKEEKDDEKDEEDEKDDEDDKEDKKEDKKN